MAPNIAFEVGDDRRKPCRRDSSGSEKNSINGRDRQPPQRAAGLGRNRPLFLCL